MFDIHGIVTSDNSQNFEAEDEIKIFRTVL